jgi:release factor glutamine methyltransferase
VTGDAGDPAGPGERSGSGAGRDSRDRLAERRGLERGVYGPAEDSRLLAEAALDHATGRVLEVGTGSGWVAQRVAAAGHDVVASDVNPAACRQARERALESAAADGFGYDVVRADLVAPFRDGAFETVLFNPPYLPTDPDNEWDDWMERALSGGESGRAVVTPFLRDVGRVLAPGGTALVVVSSLAGYDEVLAVGREAGLAGETVREESYPFETLSVVRFDPG